MTQIQANVSLFGAPLDSGNLGVSALGLSTIHGLAKRIPSPTVTLFDNGRKLRRRDLEIGDIKVAIEHRGAWISRRVYRPESLWSMNAASRTLPAVHPNLRALARSSAVLDISGGDSFTDLYGLRRFELVSLPKLISLRLGRPLILLPQTYGPFKDPESREVAADLVRGATQAWARDANSFEALKELAGDAFDPRRHRLGADVAFALPQRAPDITNATIIKWLRSHASMIGLNVSGLLYKRAELSSTRFGLRADYAKALRLAARRLLDETDDRILLVPHVYGERESDIAAAGDLASELDEPERVTVVDDQLEPDQIKSLIARCSWFSGARMHSTIAALSSGVPAAAVAYSDKFAGVFAGCGLGDRILDARKLSTEDLAAGLYEAYRVRADDRERLAAQLPTVHEVVAQQFDAIANSIRTADETAGGRR